MWARFTDFEACLRLRRFWTTSVNKIWVATACSVAPQGGGNLHSAVLGCVSLAHPEGDSHRLLSAAWCIVVVVSLACTGIATRGPFWTPPVPTCHLQQRKFRVSERNSNSPIYTCGSISRFRLAPRQLVGHWSRCRSCNPTGA